MVRSRWKHKYHNYYLLKKLERCGRREVGFHLIKVRNKATVLSRFLLNKIFKLKTFIQVYTGKSYIMLNLALVLAKTRLGEYVFTKWRTKRIHPLRGLRGGRGKKGAKRGRDTTKQRRGPIWSLRLRINPQEKEEKKEEK